MSNIVFYFYFTRTAFFINELHEESGSNALSNCCKWSKNLPWFCREDSRKIPKTGTFIKALKQGKERHRGLFGRKAKDVQRKENKEQMWSFFHVLKVKGWCLFPAGMMTEGRRSGLKKYRIESMHTYFQKAVIPLAGTSGTFAEQFETFMCL